MSSIGLKAEAASSDGNRIEVNAGFASPCVNRGVPHSEQKLRVARAPLLPCTEKVFGLPVTWRCSVGTITPDANGAPLERWQSWQWQFNIAMGATAHS